MREADVAAEIGLICRIGSLEMPMQYPLEAADLICRIGSLEK